MIAGAQVTDTFGSQAEDGTPGNMMIGINSTPEYIQAAVFLPVGSTSTPSLQPCLGVQSPFEWAILRLPICSCSRPGPLAKGTMRR